MSNPWFVRSVALLLVLVGLQSGSFQDLDAGQERYYGAQDFSAAVRAEARKTDPVLGAGSAADAPTALPRALMVARAPQRSRALGIACLPQYLLPDPTGPPRA